ncbi:unnamed protein product [Discosporangium mesarthrocarpum]
MQQKLHVHSMVAQERLVGHLLTYFTHAPLSPPSPGEQSAGAGVNGAGLGGGTPPSPPLEPKPAPSASITASLAMKAGLRTHKAKRRWCVLDATRLTYYRSRSTSRVKGHITMDPKQVSLVTPPFLVHPGSTTTENDAVAIVCSSVPPEIGTMVVRAEQMSLHEHWVGALAARLTPKEYQDRMVALYGRNN